jgi:hypothetical protein
MEIQMKKFFLPIILFLLISVSCTEDGGIGSFNLNYSTNFTIPASLPINSPIPLFTPQIETNHQQEFQKNNTTVEHVKELRLDSLNLTITSPQNQTFRFLNSVEIFIDADGLPEQLVGSKYNIPNSTGNILVLDMQMKDLAAYIKKDVFNLKVRVVTDEILTKDVDVRIDLRFFVKAQLQKK